jgi:hypothetical protein
MESDVVDSRNGLCKLSLFFSSGMVALSRPGSKFEKLHGFTLASRMIKYVRCRLSLSEHFPLDDFMVRCFLDASGG